MNGSTPPILLTSFPHLEPGDHVHEHHPEQDAIEVCVDANPQEEGPVSHPPSPPNSGTTTPTLHIDVCPTRLSPVMPPPNYGAVEHGNIFRSAFPQDRNIGFLKLLNVKHVLCLVDSISSTGYDQWIRQSGIRLTQLTIVPNKDGKVQTTWDSVCQAILVIMDPANQPGYIHCNQGRHRTGCVVACLRKVQRWPIEDVIAEYETYAAPKVRSGDIELIRAFDPEAVYQYSRKHDYFSGRRFMRRSDSVISNLDTLVAALGQARLSDEADDTEVAVGSQTTSESGDSDDVLTITPSGGSLKHGESCRHAREVPSTHEDGAIDDSPNDRHLHS